MTLTNPLFSTTTAALALMAGLATPALAQSPSDTTPRELLDAARKGELDLGFDTTTLSRDELLGEIVRAKAQCDAGTAPQELACDRIAELPDPSGWLAAPMTKQVGTQEADAPAEPLAKAAPVPESENAQQGAPGIAEQAADATSQDAPTLDDGVAALAQSLADAAEPPAAADSADAAPQPDTPAAIDPPALAKQVQPDAGTPPDPGSDAVAEALDAQAEEMPDDAPAVGREPTAPDSAAENAVEPAKDPAQQPTVENQATPLDAPAAPPTSSEQADIAARIAAQGSASAAASADSTEDAELIEEVLTDENTRSSAEDFDTRIGAAGSDDGDDDDDKNTALRSFGAAALVGLGAVALNEMLGDNAKVVENSGDRIVVEQDGQYRVLRNDDVLLRQPGSDVKTYRYDDGSTRTVVTRDSGASVETVKAADGRVLRRTRTLPNGETVVLFDDTRDETEVVINDLPQVEEAPTRRINFQEVSEDELAAALAAQGATPIDRRFSLNQVRNIDAVRHLVPEISVDSINFATGSAAIRPEEARDLAALGNAMKRAIAANPTEVFLIEGHTDATGGWGLNLALSDRRAESVALALTEYFQVPPENMVLQGYGEADLAVDTQDSERRNRRAAVRRITQLLQGG
ncbi:OmpA/MotB domain-containing protein [Citreicella sp. 357]|nr:OmpA/MotB domain-containing protein [Citreicella sp. 357]